MKKVELEGTEKVVQIGVSLPEEQVEVVALILKEFNEVFAWKRSDMKRIIKEVIAHELNIDPSITPIDQK